MLQNKTANQLHTLQACTLSLGALIPNFGMQGLVGVLCIPWKTPREQLIFSMVLVNRLDLLQCHLWNCPEKMRLVGVVYTQENT